MSYLSFLSVLICSCVSFAQNISTTGTSQAPHDSRLSMVKTDKLKLFVARNAIRHVRHLEIEISRRTTLASVFTPSTRPLTEDSFEQVNASVAQCSNLEVPYCEFDSDKCLRGFFRIDCYIGVSPEDVHEIMRKFMDKFPRSPMFLGLHQNILLENFTITFPNVVIMRVGDQADFRASSLKTVAAPNVLGLEFYEIARFTARRNDFSPFTRLRMIIFERTLVGSIEENAFEALPQLKRIWFDCYIPRNFTAQQKAHLVLLHCSESYQWLRDYLSSHPYLIQPFGAGQITRLPGIANQEAGLRDLFFPVDCAVPDLYGSEFQDTFSINDNGPSNLFKKPVLLSIPNASTQEESSRNLPGLTVVLPVVLAGCFLLAGIAFIVVYSRRRRKMSGATYTALKRRTAPELQEISKQRELYRDLLNVLEIPSRNVQLCEILGRGQQATVHKALGSGIRGKLGPTWLTAKCYKAEYKTTFWSEMELLFKIGRHTNVVTLLATSMSEQHLLLYEFCERGSLLDLLHSTFPHRFHPDVDTYEELTAVCDSDYNNRSQDDTSDSVPVPLTTRNLIDFSYQISRGMTFLTSRGVTHRDLAARNILVTSDLVMKIADFGLSRIITDDYVASSETLLAYKWMAPEIILSKHFSEKSDVWYYCTNCSAEEPSHIPIFLDVTYEWMRRCWSIEGECRPSFKEITEGLSPMVDAEGYLQLDEACEAFNAEYIYVQLPEQQLNADR